MRFGLKDERVNKIISVFNNHQTVLKAVIFGSRARGDFRHNSDIDIAVYTTGETAPGLLSALDEAAGIYKVNLVIMDRLSNARLKYNIEQDGIEIYNCLSCVKNN